MYGIKPLIIIIGLLFSINTLAAKIKYQCINDDYEFNGQQVVLHLTDQKQSQIYFFRNLNDQTIWLNRLLLDDASASAGWASELSPGHWSALLINKGPAVFDCAIMKANYQLESVSCQDVISVCRLSRAKVKKKQEGSYWLVEDSKTENTLLQQVKKRGISW